jgi:hypothetical protein
METPDAVVEDVAGVVVLLGETINQVRRGALDAKIAHCTGYLSSILLRALEGAELAKLIQEQGEQIATLREEMEAMRRERNAQKTVAARTNGTGSAPDGNGEESAAGSNPSRRFGNPDASGDDSRFLADDVASFLR